MEHPGEAADDLPMRLAEHLDATFEELVRSYQDRLYRFALRLSGSNEEAEEIAQDAFVRAYEALKGYEPERIQKIALRPWLYQICLNVFRNRVRRRRLHPIALDDERAEDREDLPDEVAEAAERVQDLARRLTALPERYRTAVVLRHIEELSIAEISTITRQPDGTVKSNIHRGMQLLQRAVRLERQEVTG